jgi:hypothetical protein
MLCVVGGKVIGNVMDYAIEGEMIGNDVCCRRRGDRKCCELWEKW